MNQNYGNHWRRDYLGTQMKQIESFILHFSSALPLKSHKFWIFCIPVCWVVLDDGSNSHEYHWQPIKYYGKCQINNHCTEIQRIKIITKFKNGKYNVCNSSQNHQHPNERNDQKCNLTLDLTYLGSIIKTKFRKKQHHHTNDCNDQTNQNMK
jgi:hypothetical protein